MTNQYEQLIQDGELIIVGSIKWKDSPKDLDIVLVLNDNVFRDIFHISNIDYIVMVKTGNWNEEKWIHNTYTLRCREILDKRFNSLLMVDLRILSRTLYNYYTEVYGTQGKKN